MKDNEWIDDVVGCEWVDRACSNGKYDCWGLVIDYCRRVLDFEPPEIHGYKEHRDFIDCVIEAVSLNTWAIDDQGFLFLGHIDNEPVHCGVVIGDRVIHSSGHPTIAGGQVCNHPLRRVLRLFESVEIYLYAG